MHATNPRRLSLPTVALGLAGLAIAGVTLGLTIAIADDAPAKEETSGSLSWTKPAGWVAQTPSSGMRKAQYKLPKAEGAADGEMVVYFFGGRAGGVEANIERWLGQFVGADGKPRTKADAKIDSKTVGGFKVTTVDLEGRYVASVRPGAPEKHDKPGHRMLAAIVTTSEGNFFFKALGPKETLARWEKAFGELVGSYKPAAK